MRKNLSSRSQQTRQIIETYLYEIIRFRAAGESGTRFTQPLLSFPRGKQLRFSFEGGKKTTFSTSSNPPISKRPREILKTDIDLKPSTTTYNVSKESTGAIVATTLRVDVKAHKNISTVEQPSRVRADTRRRGSPANAKEVLVPDTRPPPRRAFSLSRGGGEATVLENGTTAASRRHSTI